MFHDKSFKLKYSVDKRGRPVDLTTSDNLKKFYELSSSDSDDDDKDDDQPKTSATPQSPTSKNNEEAPNESAPEQSSSESESSEASSSDDDDEQDSGTSAESGIDEDDSEIPWHEFDKDTERSDQISPRLAVCNMDWDRIKATDIFVLLNSFKPTNGLIKSVRIYLSDYGRERIAYENLHGPKELTEGSTTTTAVVKPENEKPVFEHGDSDDDGDNLNRTKLRAYQFNRLRYYYAVVECDSDETANKIYTECDGMEYESSCTRLDLRFVPDSEAFEVSAATDSCVEAPDPLTFKPNLFFTTALNQTKVECTWDETPRDRLAITMKKYTEEDLKNSSEYKRILASSESESGGEEEGEEGKGSVGGERSVEEEEDGDEEEKRMRVYRDLLFGMEEKSREKRNGGLSFDWGDGAEDSAGSDDDEDNLVNKKKSMWSFFFFNNSFIDVSVN